MEVGIKGRYEFIVKEENTAKYMECGGLRVLATPYMVDRLEKTAWESVEPYLEEGMGTVGIALNITHDAATPVGMKVVCTSELVAIDGRKLTFKVEAFDEKGHIGGGTHDRFIINNEKFMAKCNGKLSK